MSGRVSPDIHSRFGRGVAQPGSALDWGSRGRWFESSRPDHIPEREMALGHQSGGLAVLGCVGRCVSKTQRYRVLWTRRKPVGHESPCRGISDLTSVERAFRRGHRRRSSHGAGAGDEPHIADWVPTHVTGCSLPMHRRPSARPLCTAGRARHSRRVPPPPWQYWGGKGAGDAALSGLVLLSGLASHRLRRQPLCRDERDATRFSAIGGASHRVAYLLVSVEDCVPAHARRYPVGPRRCANRAGRAPGT